MKKAYQIKCEEDETSDVAIQHEKKETIRLNKFISSSGFCSRREADRYIEAGRVRVDGEVVGLSTKVLPHQVVHVDGQEIQNNRKLVYIILHKPVGITCTTDTTIPGNIISFMDYKETIFPIGRLDKESSGLILLTNDGDVVNKILRSVNNHEKEYIVCINKGITDDIIEKLSNGIQIYNPVTNTYQITEKAKVTKVGPTTFRIILTQGLNRQIRRMCTALNCKVNSLQRVRVMNIKLDHIQVGQWRYVNAEELRVLNDSLQASTSNTE